MADLSGSLNPVVPEVFRVRSVRKDLADVRTLELESETRPGPFRFEAGQFNMLYPFGKGEAAISISGDPCSPDVLTHTIRAVGAVSQALCNLKVGDPVGVRGPFGSGWPVDQARGQDVVLLAGGLGLAPLRSAFHRILADRLSYGRVILVYGTRTPADILYGEELEQWRGRFDLEVLVTVDRGTRDWKGEVGVVTPLIPRLRLAPDRTIALVCGPEIMMRLAILALIQAGLSPERVFLSMERNMKCAVGFCGHCQYGPSFLCKDGPVFAYSAVSWLFGIREV